MKKKHIIKYGKRLVKKKIKLIKESKQPKFLFEGRLEDLKNSWSEFVNAARREGKETTEAAKILAKIINRKDKFLILVIISWIYPFYISRK